MRSPVVELTPGSAATIRQGRTGSPVSDRTMDTNAGYAKTCRTNEAAGSGKALFSILAYFALHILCSPARFIRVLGRLSANISMQIPVFQLLRMSVYARFVCANPKFLFKYLPPKYLIRDLSAPLRATCFLHHYRRLHALLSSNLLRRILQEDVVVFQAQEDGHHFEIAMGRSREIENSRHIDHEGELSIHLLVDRVHVYVLSFTIVPGTLADLQAPEVLLVSRVQGSLGVFPKISLVSKAMHGIPAEMLLVATLQGVGAAFGIGTMAGVSAEHHLCYDEEDDAIFRKSYDEFFARIGAVKNSAGFFAASFPLPEKPLSLVKRGQKTRARARRAIKMRVALETFDYFRDQRSAIVNSFRYSADGTAMQSADAAGAPEKCLPVAHGV